MILITPLFLLAYRKMARCLSMASEHDLALFLLFLSVSPNGGFQLGYLPLSRCPPAFSCPCVLGLSCCLCIKCPCLHVWWILLFQESAQAFLLLTTFQPLPVFYQRGLNILNSVFWQYWALQYSWLLVLFSSFESLPFFPIISCFHCDFKFFLLAL